jgi:diguanylate cyclase (GGDEF)-like protein
MEPAVLKPATERPDANAARKDGRLRAAYRRELQKSIYLSAYVVAAGLAVSGAVLGLVMPGSGVLFAILVAPLAVASLMIAHFVRRRGRRYVVVLGMALGIMPVLTSTISVDVMPPTTPLCFAAAALMPIAFAVFIPLQRRPHILWLLTADVLLLSTLPWIPLDARDPDALAMAFAAALGTGFSLGANEIQLRRRAEMNRQILAVRKLYGRMKEHELDLRRQDEFLFMQQETLVVQQAELLRLNEELETIARLDALTGLGNRLRLNEDLAQLAARIERNGGTAGLLLMDLDRFKRLNDTAGHLAGDAALRGVADVLRKTSRVGDGLYRYGGEEFLVLLHDCDEAVLRSAGQRYLSALEAAGMNHEDNHPYGVVTASAGATELCQLNCGDVDSALHDADDALYEAKSRGRNRLEVHSHRHNTTFSIDRARAAS